jgi:4-amino-4-deoxy-L-arabinose transferase-like glycosyltransferase
MTLRTACIACSMLALTWVIAARALGPSDLEEKNQDRTIGYTQDMLERGRWILPHDPEDFPATKPPLYNWLAVPGVAAFGDHELIHKLPSVLALISCWFLLVCIGVTIGGRESPLGWAAAMVFLTAYSTFQLGYLARPDMLLTLWILLGWAAATALILRTNETAHPGLPLRSALILRLIFWLSIALALLTKGPPALVLIAYAILAPGLITGRWRHAMIFQWQWGLPLSVLPFAVWLWGVWMMDARHLIDQLWMEEVFGRVTGTGEEGITHGPIDFLYRLFHMPLYYITRFLPWSILSILAMVEVWRRADGDRAWRAMPAPGGVWLHACAIFVALIIAFFTFSTGKRAAYIAAAYGPGAILAAWWMLHILAARRRWLAWLVPIVSAVVLAAMTAPALVQE